MKTNIHKDPGPSLRTRFRLFWVTNNLIKSISNCFQILYQNKNWSEGQCKLAIRRIPSWKGCHPIHDVHQKDTSPHCAKETLGNLTPTFFLCQLHKVQSSNLNLLKTCLINIFIKVQNIIMKKYQMSIKVDSTCTIYTLNNRCINPLHNSYMSTFWKAVSNCHQ